MNPIKTDRLLLRPLRAQDAPEVTRLISDWNVIRWLTAPPWPYRLEDAQCFLASGLSKEVYAITHEDQLMGAVGLHARAEGAAKELGYWLGAPFHGHGYMTEAASAAVDAHFASGAYEIYSGYLIGNGPSANVLAKLGFRIGGMRSSLSRPLARDVMVQEVRLKAKDWQARHAA